MIDRICVVSAPSGTPDRPYIVRVDGEALLTSRGNARRFASKVRARMAGERRLRIVLAAEGALRTLSANA